MAGAERERAASASVAAAADGAQCKASSSSSDDATSMKAPSMATPGYEKLAAAALVVITLASIPFNAHVKSWQYVWWCGWLTAVSTGLGALPFLYVKKIDKYWLGICNGLAAGMMLAATGCLFYEGFHVKSHSDDTVSVTYRLLVGVLLGVIFIKSTKVILEEHEDVKVCGLDGMDARKALLIMAVMTLHSISEGIGVGVSFGGEGGDRRGLLVSLTLAIHNIPEGLAICLVLIPRGLKLLPAVLWCIMSSIPQPMFAVPAFLFVENFLPILPAGLGFAGGAMAYVAICELLPESVEDTECKYSTSLATTISLIAMLNVQYVLTGEL